MAATAGYRDNPAIVDRAILLDFLLFVGDLHVTSGVINPNPIGLGYIVKPLSRCTHPVAILLVFLVVVTNSIPL